MLRFIIQIQTQLDALIAAGGRRERGQATVEYVLLLLGAAAVALLVVAWATKTSKISTLLNKVIDAVAGRVG